MKDQMDYWDKTWKGRIESNGKVLGNQKKYEKILEFIWRRPQYFHLTKLEVGCGPAQHALQVAQYAPKYTDRHRWKGVDLSEAAIEHAKSYGLDAHHVDFLTWKTSYRFQCFTFWDSLEHFEDLDSVADKVNELAVNEFMIQGNIPLYISPIHEKGGVEKHIDITLLRRFWEKCGCPNQGYEVYGVYGFPYLMFEANNFKGAS